MRYRNRRRPTRLAGLGAGGSAQGGDPALLTDPDTLWLEGDSRVYEDTAGTDAAEDAEGVANWTSGVGSLAFVQATGGSRPTYSASADSLTFDGTADHLAYAGSVADAVGTLVVAFATGATAFAARGDQVLFASADDDAADEWFEVGIDGTGRVYLERNAAGTVMRVVGSTFLDVSTGYVLTVTHDGTDYYADVSGVEQNPLTVDAGTLASAWFGDVSGADNLVVGGTVTSAGLVRPFQGRVYEIRLYGGDITH